MIHRILFLGLFAAIVATTTVSAAEAPGFVRPSFLPSDTAILAALDASPALAEARAGLQGARASARMFAAGDHEFIGSLTSDRRQVRGEGDYAEWSAQISRGWRSQGKRALDLNVGAAGERAASDMIEDARHQASLQFASLWVGWLEAEALAEIDRRELETYERDLIAVTRRVDLKDAAPLERDQALAVTARAKSAATVSWGAAQAIRAELDTIYPQLTPVRAPALPAPSAPLRPFEFWLTVIPQRSHEITIARALADREVALSRRARLDQRPDPTIGLRTFNERGGAEIGLGVALSIPLGGALRSATAERQAAAASAAQARYSSVVRAVDLLAKRDVIEARSSLLAWDDAEG
ncbi:MAG: hypothetical protein Q8K85_05205, partial [Hyphomicrobium sp.]|nr:hypothetical protein [Hyphomicrobium sp.]